MAARTSIGLATPEVTGQPRTRRSALAFSAATPKVDNAEDQWTDSDMDSFRSSEAATIQDGEAVIIQCTSSGDLESAEYWIDRVYAKQVAEAPPNSSPYMRMAAYIKNLTTAQRFLRIIAFVERYSLHLRHLYFTHFYFNALYRRKMYIVITQASIGHLLEVQGVQLKHGSAPCGGTGEGDLPALTIEDAAELKKLCDANKIESGLLVLLGRAFLAVENRDAASCCLIQAYFSNPACLAAENLLNKFDLVPKRFAKKFEKFQELRHLEGASYADFDPRERMAQANIRFSRGDASGANQLTTEILEKYGLYQDALLVHISSLVQLDDTERLFLLAHQLVDNQPDSEISWYAVSMYYFMIKNNTAAKSFMNKATTINDNFGEGWLAFGHILAADAEHEQAMNCYLRAARVNEKNFEPLLYIAMGHCYTSNLKLATDFLRDASAIAPESPVLIHEQGCLAYARKEFGEALKLFEKALRIVAGEPANEEIDCLSLLGRPFDLYWEPLINNLAFVHRRLSNFKESIKYHHKSLLMVPRKVNSIASLGMANACMQSVVSPSSDSSSFLRETALAAQHFHHALAIKPYNVIVKSALERMMTIAFDHYKKPTPETKPATSDTMSVEELKKALDDGEEKEVVTRRRKHEDKPETSSKYTVGKEETPSPTAMETS